VSTRVKAAAALVGLAMIGVLATLGWIYWIGGAEQLQDGRGALSGGGATHAFDVKNGPGWTIGFLLCVNSGFDSVVLDGTVRGASVIAGDLTLVGAQAGQATLHDGAIVDSAQGFPPQTGTRLYPASGYVVRTPCELNAPNPTGPFTVLDFGVHAQSGDLGGGWEGIEIGYSIHGFHHVLTTESSVYICGRGMPADVCGNPLPHA